jgi:hypothetical protein
VNALSFRNYKGAKDQVKYAVDDYYSVSPDSSIMYLAPKEFKRKWASDPEFRA